MGAQEAPARAPLATTAWRSARSPRPHRRELGRLALRAHTHHVPDQTDAFQRADHERRRVELPAAKSVLGGGRERMVVVVPGLAERKRCQPGEVARLVTGV